MKRIISFVALLCICLIGTTSCRRHRTPKKISFVSTELSRNKNGKDSGSRLNNRKQTSNTLSLLDIVSGTPSDNIILQNTGFVVCYNPHKGTPSWVAWELISDETDIYIHTLEEYTKMLLRPENISHFGTPFQWTFASGRRGKDIQLKCKILK